VFICECYSFGGGEYFEVTENVGRVDAIVINSVWCSYSFKLKMSCRDDKVGIFDFAGFMAAINLPKFWNYMTKAEKEMLKDASKR
jgi:hypothetical protein